MLQNSQKIRISFQHICFKGTINKGRVRGGRVSHFPSPTFFSTPHLQSPTFEGGQGGLISHYPSSPIAQLPCPSPYELLLLYTTPRSWGVGRLIDLLVIKNVCLYYNFIFPFKFQNWSRLWWIRKWQVRHILKSSPWEIWRGLLHVEFI